MQFIYIDETGLAEEPIGVMAGVIADSHRMRITKEHWNGLLLTLSEIIGKNIEEIHTRDFYSGNSPWRNLNGNQRSAIITAIFNWLKDRKHSIVYTAVNKQLFFNNFKNEKYFDQIKSLWRFMALHLTLAIQKRYQGVPRGNKRTINTTGSCVLIFDNEYKEEKHFTDLILNPPDWIDTYYDKKQNQDKFSQIVDVPHFVDSKDVGLIQLADFICFFIRRFIEIEMGFSKIDYHDEKEKVKNWINLIFKQSISKSCIFLSKGRCDCSNLFYKYAPDILKK